MSCQHGGLECAVERVDHQPALAIRNTRHPACGEDRALFANGRDEFQILHRQATAIPEADDQFNA
jgi:hypothetical protein